MAVARRAMTVESLLGQRWTRYVSRRLDRCCRRACNGCNGFTCHRQAFGSDSNGDARLVAWPRGPLTCGEGSRDEGGTSASSSANQSG
ncbi:hypothetical protein IG631_13270 [Alternaria alternata]|nr:hypothetical protein IG631_13270 [Alternaria alternata]